MSDLFKDTLPRGLKEMKKALNSAGFEPVTIFFHLERDGVVVVGVAAVQEVGDAVLQSLEGNHPLN